MPIWKSKKGKFKPKNCSSTMSTCSSILNGWIRDNNLVGHYTFERLSDSLLNPPLFLECIDGLIEETCFAN